MSQPPAESRPRILIIDDNRSIHEDFLKILGGQAVAQARIADVEEAIFGQFAPKVGRAEFRIDSAAQGQEALELVKKALQEGDPYVLAFIDVRMPPGWDGIETLEQIWKCTPELQAVICTAYSDYSWDDITRRLGQSDNLLILKKPFETVEVLQMAHALTRKWALARWAKLRMEDLDCMVRQRADELVAANRNLQREIEERTRVQEALRVSEERFSKAFECSPIPLAIQNWVDHRFLDANQSFLELSGYTAGQLLKQTDHELQLWVQRPDLSSSALSPEGRLRMQSRLLRRSDGTIRQTLLSAEPLRLGDTPCLLLIVEDVTDRLKLEAQLRQAQKMEAVGSMSAGVAHEFNNILTVIQGSVGLLQTANPPPPGESNPLDQIMQASQRAATLTKQLLAFSRKQVMQPRWLNISTIVRRMEQMLGRLIGEKYKIDLRCPNDLPSIFADEGCIAQVLINLALNARDAMPDGGVLNIETGLSVLNESAAASHREARAGRFVWLSVSDHGCGMGPQVLARIFDPFFTTKGVGKGTGLGLSTIHGIVKQHEGWIDVTSQVGRGSTFRVFLPAGVEPPSQPVTSGTGDDSVSEVGKGETVLVVEDEPAVRELACAALNSRGYQVIKAADGPEALQVWERCSAQVDLLLTDMVMPSGMSGDMLAKTLQSRNPQLKVIYTSGYTPEFMQKDSPLPEETNFLPKPYDLDALFKAVRICLDGGTLRRGKARSPETEEALATG